MLLGHHGMRINAVRNLRWQDIDYERGVIVWPAKYQKQGVDVTQPITWTTHSALLVARHYAGVELAAARGRPGARRRREVGTRREPGRPPIETPFVLFAQRKPTQAYSYSSFHSSLQRAETWLRRSRTRSIAAAHGFRKMVVGNVIEATGDRMLGLEFVGDYDKIRRCSSTTTSARRAHRARVRRDGGEDEPQALVPHGHRPVLRRRRELARRGRGRPRDPDGDEPLEARRRDAQHELPRRRPRLRRHLGERSAPVPVDRHPDHEPRVHHALAGGREQAPEERAARPLHPDGARPRDAAEPRDDVGRRALREYHQYRAIIVENVVEVVRTWPLFWTWWAAMEALGYVGQIVSLNSMFAHPTPQSRDRIYIVWTRKGNKRPDLAISPLGAVRSCGDVEARQTWKTGRTVGKYGPRNQYVYTCPTCRAVVTPYYYCALNALDFSIPAERIGDRKWPLRPRTLERVRYGLEKYGRRPLQVTVNNISGVSCRVRGVEDPLFGQTTSNTTAVSRRGS
jgi:hypothetical protein